jgi:hypothetical protein
MGVDQNVNILANAATPPAIHFGSVIHWDNQMTWYQMDNGCHVSYIDKGMTSTTMYVDGCSADGHGSLNLSGISSTVLPATLPMLTYSSGAYTNLTITSGTAMSIVIGMSPQCPGTCGTFNISGTPFSTCASNCGGFHTTYTFTKAQQYLAADINFGVSNITTKFSATPPWCNASAGTWYACADLSAASADTAWTNFLTAFLTIPVPLPTGPPGNSSTPGQMLSAIECWNEVTFNDTSKPIKGFFDQLSYLVTMCTDLRNTAKAINPAIKIGTPSVGTNSSLNSNFSMACSTMGNGEMVNACAANIYMGTSGACAAADYVAVHDEPIGMGSMQVLPEQQALWSLVAGQGNYCTGLPIWDTEYGASAAGIAGNLPAFGDLNYQDYFTLLGGYFAREILMRVTNNVQASYLFQLSRYPTSGEVDNPMLNQDGSLNPAGVEWNIFWGWIMSASVSACTSTPSGSSFIYTCGVTRPGGYTATIAWWRDVGAPGNCSRGYNGGTYGPPPSGTGTYSACPVHTGWPTPVFATRSRDLLGSLVTGIVGGTTTATLTALPQIFESGPPPAVGTMLTNVMVTNATVE